MSHPIASDRQLADALVQLLLDLDNRDAVLTKKPHQKGRHQTGAVNVAWTIKHGEMSIDRAIATAMADGLVATYARGLEIGRT